MDMSIRFPGLNLVLDHVPRSFEIFGFEITIYGVLIAIGMLLGIFFVVLEARRNHEDPDAYLDLAIITLLSGVAGARLLYAAFSWSLYKNDPGQLLNIRSGGLMADFWAVCWVVRSTAESERNPSGRWQILPAWDF